MRTLRIAHLIAHLGFLLLLCGSGCGSSYTSGTPDFPTDMGLAPDGGEVSKPEFRVGSFDVPGGQRGLAVANLDNEEVPEIVVSLPYEGKLAILWNLGAAGQPPSIITVPGTPSGLTMTDLNGDMVPDLAFTDPSTGSLNVFYTSNPFVSRSAPFTTTQPITYPVGQGASVVQAGLLNGDDYPDLAVLNTQDGTVSVFINSGPAGMYMLMDRKTRDFPGPSHYSMTLVPSLIPRASDILVTSASDDTLTFLRNTGTGALVVDQTATGRYSTARGPVFVTAAALPKDSIPLVYVADSSSNLIQSWLSAQGELKPQPTVGIAIRPVALAVDDLNLDGRLDVVVASNGNDALTVLLGTAGGQYRAPEGTSFSTGQAPIAVVIAEVNGNYGSREQADVCRSCRGRPYSKEWTNAQTDCCSWRRELVALWVARRMRVASLRKRESGTKSTAAAGLGASARQLASVSSAWALRQASGRTG